LPPLQEDGEGGGLGDGCEGGGGDDRDGGGLPEGEGGLDDDESCESDGGVDLEPPELGDGGGLDQPLLDLGGELELEPRGGGALELLPPPFPPSLDDDELGDGAMSDMLFFLDMPPLLVEDPSWYYVPLTPKTSSSLS